MTSIPLFLTSQHPCSYLEGELARSVFVAPSFHLLPAHYSRLIEQGFRRSGDKIYAPHCSQCSACIPARLAVAEFRPNKSQKRCLKKNMNTKAVIKPAVFEQAHYDMYLRYQTIRHSSGSMAESSPEEYINFLASTWCDTLFVEFLINNELAAIAVVDQFSNAWSAVYTFFEPGFSSYSLGVYAVLWQIEQAKLQGREFLYLGFWIKQCKKMAYKIDYQPLQLLVGNEWIEAAV